jgi:hypothetical protein
MHSGRDMVGFMVLAQLAYPHFAPSNRQALSASHTPMPVAQITGRGIACVNDYHCPEVHMAHQPGPAAPCCMLGLLVL